MMFTIRIYSFLLKAVCAACNFLYVTNGQRGMHPSLFYPSLSFVSLLVKFCFLNQARKRLAYHSYLKDRKALRWRIATNGGEASSSRRCEHADGSVLSVHELGARNNNAEMRRSCVVLFRVVLFRAESYYRVLLRRRAGRD